MNNCSGCNQVHARENQRYCNACHAKYMRENRRKHHELAPESKLKANARAYANVYLKRGKIVKQPCQCGSLTSEMHHADYSKPTEVTWLCRKCHLLLHVEPRHPSKSLTTGNFHAIIRAMTSTNSRSLKFRVQEYLPALKSRETTNREVAALLGCNEEALCRLLSKMGFKRDPAINRKAMTDLNKERTRFREEVANRPGITPEEAAKICNVSPRTIYRYKK